MWGLTAVYAYWAYREQSFLNDAIAIWEALAPWIVTPTHATSGSHPLKNARFPTDCGTGESDVLSERLVMRYFVQLP